ncbi:MAG: polymorphic toxin-type HINT domain-containing protein, partial [Hyphomicrobiales bacterium]
VTSEHPLFTVGEGWLDAYEIVAGDRVRNSELRELTVLAVEVDTRPQIVHNLEIADAHTYFAGELEAWGHNKKKNAKSRVFASENACAIANDEKGHRTRKNGNKQQKHQKNRSGARSKARAGFKFCKRKS